MPKGKDRQRTPHGICKLTGQYGVYVESHIIPEALTRPSIRGNPLIEHGEGRRPSRRWTSWYDSQLVTAEGERYLSDLDSWAISILRRHKLVWSGWGNETGLGRQHTVVDQTLGIRSIDGIDTKRLRLFFHSLLWRAAASAREELKDILVSNEELEVLRAAILGTVAAPLDFYPVQLTQLSTRGIAHNQTPIPDRKYLPNPYVPGGSPIALPTYRFYMDGLIAHMYCAMPVGYSVQAIGNLILGVEDSVVLPTIAFDDSRQSIDLAAAVRDSERILARRPQSGTATLSFMPIDDQRG